MIKQFFLAITLLTVTWACGDSSSEQKTPSQKPSTYTLLFFDKTSSVDVTNNFVAQKYQSAIQQIIEDNIHKQGDKLEIYFIHENTSKARALSLTARTQAPETEGMNATDKEAAQTDYDLSIRKEKGVFQKQTLNKLLQPNHESSNKETNITASIPIIAKACETGADVHVYYFSDMVESLLNGRDFHKTPPANSSQAAEWAKADAEKMQDLSLNGAAITAILPFEPTTSSKVNNPNISVYWQTLFEQLGVMYVEEL